MHESLPPSGGGDFFFEEMAFEGQSARISNNNSVRGKK